MKQCWNKTKVVCTIGPSSTAPRILKQMLVAGMDIARFNFSHENIASHIKNIKTLQNLSQQTNIPVAVLIDLPGPKIRIGKLSSQFVFLKKGENFTLTRNNIIGDKSHASVNYPKIIDDINTKDVVYLSDGQIKLKAIAKNSREIIFKVIEGGRLSSRKGLNAPKTHLSVSSPTRKDISYLKNILKHDIDFVAVSFVSSGEDILKVKKIIARSKKKISVIAKIEKKEALDNIDEIIGASDAIMVARGDLGVEIPIEKIPAVQKMIIEKCNRMTKPVITATQMLESMVNSMEPTRAEVTDIANAIIDGTDAVMLSEETAAGKYPVAALKTMIKVAHEAEKEFKTTSVYKYRLLHANTVSHAVSLAAATLAENLKAALIIIPTLSGNTARLVSNLRPTVPIFALTPNAYVSRQMLIYWGVCPKTAKNVKNFNSFIEYSLSLAKQERLIKRNDKIVLACGVPGKIGMTNMLQVVTYK